MKVLLINMASLLLLLSYYYYIIFQEFCEFRAKCGLLWCYDWVSIPMVYTQVQIYTYILVLGSGVYTHGVHPGTNIHFYSGVRIGCLYPLLRT